MVNALVVFVSGDSFPPWLGAITWGALGGSKAWFLSASFLVFSLHPQTTQHWLCRVRCPGCFWHLLRNLLRDLPREPPSPQAHSPPLVSPVRGCTKWCHTTGRIAACAFALTGMIITEDFLDVELLWQRLWVILKFWYILLNCPLKKLCQLLSHQGCRCVSLPTLLQGIMILKNLCLMWRIKTYYLSVFAKIEHWTIFLLGF